MKYTPRAIHPFIMFIFSVSTQPKSTSSLQQLVLHIAIFIDTLHVSAKNVPTQQRACQHIPLRGTKEEMAYRLSSFFQGSKLLQAQKVLFFLFAEERSFRAANVEKNHDEKSALAASRYTLLRQKKEEQTPISSFRIRPSSTFSTLEYISSYGKLVWNESTPLLFDTISSSIFLHCIATQHPTNPVVELELFLKSKNDGSIASFPSKKVDFIMAVPHLIHHGTLLQRLDSAISWKTLSVFTLGKSTLSLPQDVFHEWNIKRGDEEDEKCNAASLCTLPFSLSYNAHDHVAGQTNLSSYSSSKSCTSSESLQKSSQHKECSISSIQGPFPKLQLHDIRAMTVSLFMEYTLPDELTPKSVMYTPCTAGLVESTIQGASSCSSPLAERLQQQRRKKEPFRLFKEEQTWEHDLLDCGYVRQPSSDFSCDGFRYFCSFEKSYEALYTLVSIGWKAIGVDKTPILLCEKIQLDMVDKTTGITVQGSLSSAVSSLQVPICSLIPKLRHESAHTAPFFLSMKEYTILLPPLWKETLSHIAYETEIASDGSYFIPSIKRGVIASYTSHDNFTISQSWSTDDAVVPPIVFDQSQSYTSFTANLRPYQKAGVTWLLHRAARKEPAVLADEMGLGKTVQILAWIAMMRFSHPVLIVAPKGLLFNWKNEIARFLPHYPVTLFYGNERHTLAHEELSGNVIILTSFSTLRQKKENTISTPQQLFSTCAAIVVDEAQYVKNAESQTFHALLELNALYKIIMTGTPIENSVSDLWSHFRFLAPSLLGKKEDFLAPFSSLSQQLRQKELFRTRKLIEPYILRRTKKMVAHDLPDIIDQTVWVEMDEEQKNRYGSFLASLQKGSITKKLAEDDTRQSAFCNTSGKKRQRMHVLEGLLRMRQLVCHHLLFQWSGEQAALSSYTTAKWDTLFEDIATLVSEGKKVVVFSQFATMVDLFMHEACHIRKWSAVAYHGSMPNALEDIVARFQEDPSLLLFFCTLKAGGVGINLTKADAVLLYDPWWNKASEEQAIARAHRIGRVGSVIVKRYITKDSIEERVWYIAQAKQEVFSALFDSSYEMSPSSIEDTALSSIDTQLLFQLFDEEMTRNR